MCLRRAPEKYIAGAALDRAGLDNVGSIASLNPVGGWVGTTVLLFFVKYFLVEKKV
jgi:hypothetical protein